jgi:cbb3-type cytochrome oxidase subunit 3
VFGRGGVDAALLLWLLLLSVAVSVFALILV